MLLAFGLVVHYSAGSNTSNQLEQMRNALLGIIAMIGISFIKVDVYKKISSFMMAMATLLMFAVLFAPEKNGTHRWIGGIQPSEVGKITLIMFFAYLLDKYKTKNKSIKTFGVFLAMTVFFAGMIFLETHLSGTILFLCIGYAMMWYGDMPKKYFLVFTAFVLLFAAIFVLKPEGFCPPLKEYQVDRIVVWKKVLFNKEITAKERIGNARQVLQSLYGIGSGGFFGKGYGNSGQKISNLSEKSNDFIFAVLGEELGFVGGIIILVLFGALVFFGFRIALNTKSYYGTLLAMGISTQMALQVIINISVATSLLPNTGISLPFFSDGGSSLFMTLVSMGLMLGVSRDSAGNPEEEENA
ncbi:MAG: FtsW/RodA/SpoVE family cell cycle protein [Clostridia bacterium]|nr:FtsW/RodA/SpoVE family cell cycle protein [Clostridia bacterium]